MLEEKLVSSHYSVLGLLLPYILQSIYRKLYLLNLLWSLVFDLGNERLDLILDGNRLNRWSGDFSCDSNLLLIQVLFEDLRWR